MTELVNDSPLERENKSLWQENARLLAALEEIRSKLIEPAEVIRAIRQGEIDALVVQEDGEEEIYSLQRFDSVYRTVVEICFPYGVWLAKPDGKLLYVSPSFLDLLQTNLAQIREKGQFYFLQPDVRESIEREWARCRESGEAYNVEYTIKLADGTEKTIWTQGLLSPTHDGTLFWVGVNIDVTEREKIKTELLRQAEILRRQTEALKEIDRRKDEFLATLAHELRGPLAPIRNGLELLRRADSVSPMIEQARNLMERQLQRLVRLIDDLLEVSRLTSGKMRLRKERVELTAIVQSAVEATRSLMESQHHELTVSLTSEPVYLHADPVRVEQILVNLLTNAAKYTPEQGHIWLSLEKSGHEVLISVRDTGIGIAAEHLPQIFEMFSQMVPALERAQGGLGIGLALVKGLVEMHGGQVKVRSRGEGMGSEFIICLPVVEDALPVTQEWNGMEEGVSNGPTYSILVVDDNRDAADSLTMLLRLRGHEVHTAYDGLEAVRATTDIRPNVVLLDIGLPKMNGYEVARRIKEQPWGKGIAIFALTGWGQEEDKFRALDAGCHYHLTKPVDPAALEKLLTILQMPSDPR